MPNEDRAITLFDFYSYGQDRWGALPFLLARLFHQASGYHWSVESMHLYRTVWLFVGLLVMTSLSRRCRIVVLLSGLMAICLPELTRLHMFDLSELYAWQIPGLFLSWYLMRRLFGTDLPGAQADVSANKPGVFLMRAIWGFLLFCVSFLTVWTSLASGPFLCFLVILEAVRADLGSSRGQHSRWLRGRYVFGLALVAFAMVAERLLRVEYHRYCLKTFGDDNRTRMAFDFGHLRENLTAQMNTCLHFSWWPLTVLPLLLLLVFAVTLVYFWRKEKVVGLQRLRHALSDDTFILLVGTWGIAMMNLAMTIFIEHIRLSEYNARFLTLTLFFGVVSGLLTIFWVLSYLVEMTHFRKYAISGVTFATLLFLMIEFPPRNVRADYLIDNKTAITLAERAPGATLIAGYWETYVLVALQKTNTMLPLPLEGERMRVPWTPRMLGDAKQVIVSYRHINPANSTSVPLVLIQYGITLRLVDPNWYANEKYSFALYVNQKM